MASRKYIRKENKINKFLCRVKICVKMQFMMIVKHHHLNSFAAFSFTNKRNKRRTKKNYIFMTKKIYDDDT